MDIKSIDKNFLQNSNFDRENTDLYDVREAPFALYGVFFDESRNAFARMPSAVANTVNEGVAYLSGHTAGGRVRFSTDSKTLTLLVEYDRLEPMPHMATSGCCGFALCKREGEKEVFVKSIFPELNERTGFVRKVELPVEGVGEYTLHFPLYQSIRRVFVGLEKRAFVGKGRAYAPIPPVVYYGSSITQGGCASRADNSYQGFVSKRNNVDFINLGFSGSARGEREIIDYLTGLDCSVMVFDYDHNAPTVEHLRNTHFAAYERYRKAKPTTPILFLSKPDAHLVEETKQRAEIVCATYERAKANGDDEVYHIDGRTLFEGNWEDSTVDGCHPTDFGFYQMSLKIGDVLEEIINKKNN